MNTPAFDFILLPGIRLRDDGGIPDEMLLRVNRALDVWRASGEPVIVALGADAASVGVSEAAAMKGLLTEAGVPEDLVVTEDKSFVTSENFINARAFIPPGSRLALVTSDYHMARARLLARKAGFKVKGFTARTPGGSLKRRRRILELLGIIDALCGFQNENRTRPAPVERFKRFMSRKLTGK